MTFKTSKSTIVKLIRKKKKADLHMKQQYIFFFIRNNFFTDLDMHAKKAKKYILHTDV